MELTVKRGKKKVIDKLLELGLISDRKELHKKSRSKSNVRRGKTVFLLNILRFIENTIRSKRWLIEKRVTSSLFKQQTSMERRFMFSWMHLIVDLFATILH